MSTPRKLWTQICVLLLERASIKSATDRSSFDVILLIPPQTKGCASYYAFIIPSSPFSFVQLSPSILLLIRSSLFASCHFTAQQHNPTSCKTLKLKINFIRAVRRCLSLHCFILCFTVSLFHCFFTLFHIVFHCLLASPPRLFRSPVS